MSPEALLRVATEAYWREGPAVSVNAICQLAGVSKPSLYREFGNEDGLVSAALQGYGAEVNGQLGSLLDGELRFAAKIEALLQFASEASRSEHGCLFFKMRAARLDLGPKTKATLIEIEAAMQGILRDFFRTNLANGQWSGDIAADLAAEYLFVQMALAASLRALGTDPAKVKQLMGLALSVLESKG
jgi:TetR/AcrR family transcriptional regulator, copper-responsive repressor